MDFPSFLWGGAIGAGAIVASGFFKKAGEDGYSWLKNKISPKGPEPNEPHVVIHVNPASKADGTAGGARSDNTYAGIEKVSAISLDEILSPVTAAPPLQRSTVANRFLGLRVEWETEFLTGESRNGDQIRLHLIAVDSKSSNRSVICTVSASEYKELAILHEGAKIRVLGEIEEVNTWSVALKNARLHIHGLHRDA